MEIRALAETVLFADTVEGKLAGATQWSDRSPRSRLTIPDLPGRPPELALDTPRPRHKFPGLTHDGDLRTRGQILHYFANHELMAIELMALFLLRFPEAPGELRQAVAGTIGEEQQHLTLYLARMADFGVTLGEVPVSRFFWDCLGAMGGPLDYLAGMSLTLEQANLDYCQHYIGRFADIGDQQTASLLQQVHDDEVGHVKLGVRWFERLREPGDTRELWARYRAALREPLTPARAVGIGFDFSAREQAGLDATFIESLAAYGHSKGRPPVLHYFNPLAELHLAADQRAQNTVIPRLLSELATDLETLPMFLAGSDDAVLVSQQPRAPFLAELRRHGFRIPQFITSETAATGPQRTHGFSRLQPWAWSPDSEAVLEPFVSRQPSLNVVAPDPRCFKKSWSVNLAREWSEKNSQEWLTPSTNLGRTCTEASEAMEWATELLTSGERVVIKAPLGSAGRGMVRALSPSDLPGVRTWMVRTIERQGAVVVEPWLVRLVDLSVQLTVASDGTVRVLGVTRFETDSRGQYIGTLLGDPLRGLDEPLRRALVGPGRGWRMFEHLESLGHFVGARLHELGHRGPAGVDALVHRDDDGQLRLKPIVEVNPRCTMGHVALAVGKQLGRRRVGCFKLINQADAKRAGAGSLADFIASLPEGSICLSDPERASQVVAVVVE